MTDRYNDNDNLSMAYNNNYKPLTPAQNFASLSEVAEILYQGCHEPALTDQENDMHTHRRAYVWSVFAFIEGVTYKMKLVALDYDSEQDTLSEDILSKLRGNRVKKVTGETRTVRISTSDNIKFVFKAFSSAFNSTFVLKCNTLGWEHVLRACGVRDRLRHPGIAKALMVREDELNAVSHAKIWFHINQQLCSLHANRALVSDAPDKVEELDRHIGNYENMLRKAGL